MPEKTYVRWCQYNLNIKPDADPEAMFAAIAPPPDVEEELSINDSKSPDTLKRRLLAWGWATDFDFFEGKAVRPRVLGVYSDYTFIEDDERFMPLIAPFMEEDSRAVFEVARTPGQTDFWERDYEVWEFDGTTVTRRPVEKVVQYI